MAAFRLKELETLKKTNMAGWTEKRKENHLRAIDDLTLKANQDASKRDKQTSESGRRPAPSAGLPFARVYRMDPPPPPRHVVW